jgi:hypothetical protein
MDLDLPGSEAPDGGPQHAAHGNHEQELDAVTDDGVVHLNQMRWYSRLWV